MMYMIKKEYKDKKSYFLFPPNLLIMYIMVLK
jgi:hypothetical protein